MFPGCSADLKERALMTEDEVAMFTMSNRRVIVDLTELAVPVISAMDGTALGSGLEIAMATDIRVAGEVPARTLWRDLRTTRFGVQSSGHKFLAGVAWNRTKCKAKL